MIKNYLKIAWRNLVANKSSSIINIGGLAVGMAVAMLIGLWIWDELSYDKYHQNYNNIAEVLLHETVNGTINTGGTIPLPLEAEIRRSYGSDFKHIVMSSFTENHTLNVGDVNIAYPGSFMGADAPEMFSLKMIKGSRGGLKGQSGMLLSQSVAKAIFGDTDPMDKVIKVDNKVNFKVTGVYQDLPRNTTLHEVAFLLPWDFYVNAQDWIGRDPANWDDNSLFMYVQTAGNTDMAKLSDKIKNIILKKADPGEVKKHPQLLLQPMANWHLYSEFKNGVNTGGAIQYVWLFGIIGVFVLLLACINFMNLSTARSEKRAKEVGIRKAIGSLRSQLIKQFFCESLLIAMLAFALSILLVVLILPAFNNVANKNLTILWYSPLFWLALIGFTLFTGIIAGSYPAFYLSSFQPVKVLKGTFKVGRLAALPRKVLVVTQFTVSIVLIIGTIVIFKQIQFAQNRPVGYSRDGLVTIETNNDDLHKQFSAVSADLLKSGAAVAVSESSSPTTGVNNNRDDISWKGKDPAISTYFASIRVSTDFGKTVGWHFTNGRDFSKEFITDSLSVVLNETAVKYMGFKNPVGEVVRVGKRDLTVIGVIKDMIMDSPYDPVKQTMFYLSRADGYSYVNLRINPAMSAHNALSKIEAVCKSYSPSVPFAYKFNDEEYARKFANEERIGKLASGFAALAIFISCLGLFGMASFMAEQRTKEIGVRKVLGATVFGLWQLMSADFVMLIVVSLLIATPVAYYSMFKWLQNYSYHTGLSWWIFAATGIGAITITLLTVSYQSVKAALMNPVRSLKSE